MPSFADHVLVVLTATTRTVRGATVEDWTNPGRRTIEGCLTSPADTQELADRLRPTTVDGQNALLPYGVTPPTSADKIIFPNGKEYRVHGEVQETPSPNGGPADGYRFYAERWSTRG